MAYSNPDRLCICHVDGCPWPDPHAHDATGEYADFDTYYAAVRIIHPDADANPRRGFSCLQADLHLPRAAEPAQPGLHDERLDADADVDGGRERAARDHAAMKEKP